MDIKIENIFLTNEFNVNSKAVDETNTNTDVIVQINSGEKFIASFLSYTNVERMRNENFNSGVFLNGKYFWTKNILIIDNCEKNNVRTVIQRTHRA